MTRHAHSGKPLPRALFDKMLAAKNFQSGMQTVRQIEFALFDLELHSSFDPNGGRTALDLIRDVRRRVAVIIPPEDNRFPNSFSHIFAGGYAAGFGIVFLLAMLVPGAHLLWQLLALDTGNPQLCLKLFKSNRNTGMLIAAALILATLVA